MKKVVVFGLMFGLGIVSLSLGGCSVSQGQTDMTFDQTYDVFVQSLFTSKAFALADVMQEDKIKDKLLATMHGGNQDMKLDIDLDLSSLTDLQTHNSQTMANFDIDRYDNVKKSPLKLSGVLEFLFLNQQLYAQIHEFGMDSGSGNSEANLIKLIVDTYIKKRILMDDPNTIDVNHIDDSLIASSYQIPKKIKESLSVHQIFNKKEKTSIDGKSAYSIVLNQNAFSKFIKSLDTNLFSGLLISSGVALNLDAYLIIEDEHNVQLVFDLGGDLAYDITGEIAARDMHITIKNKVNKTVSMFSLIEKRNKLQLDINTTNSQEEETIISLNVLPKLTDLGLDFIFDGKLQFVAMKFYDPIVLDLEGSYIVEKSEFTGFSVPESPLLLHQLLGDQFALPSMILEEK